jgi:hypothetical protein
MRYTNRPELGEDNPEVAAYLRHVHAPRYVDPAFLEYLHLLDPLLEPRWNVIKHRWEIYRDNLYLMTVQTVSGEYAHLDNRVMQRLFIIDTHRYRDSFDYIRYLHLEDEHFMRMKTKEQDEFMRAVARDAAPIWRRRKTVNADPSKIEEQASVNK